MKYTRKELVKLMEYIDEHDENGEIRIPATWATVFLYTNQEVIKAFPRCIPLKQELDDIIDWIENGDPETRNND